MSRQPELVSDGELSTDEFERLSIWKWRYALENLGFTTWQARELSLLKWMRATGRV